MMKKWVIGDKYVWNHPDGTTEDVVLKSGPGTKSSAARTPPDEPPDPTPPIFRCEVEVLPNRRIEFAPAIELSLGRAPR